MSITPVSGSPAVHYSEQVTPQNAPKQQPPVPQDTVTISSTAQKLASGDVDHDGDGK